MEVVVLVLVVEVELVIVVHFWRWVLGAKVLRVLGAKV